MSFFAMLFAGLGKCQCRLQQQLLPLLLHLPITAVVPIDVAIAAVVVLPFNALFD